ncbi:MAG: hypothetical protein IK130_07070 [Oscillospiraceae bacterium]|nr:hypothetical protein [Oscillospiraceae bacterium]
MDFLDQLRAEVVIHGDMETDFRSRQYRQARDLARKYIDTIQEDARIAARCGNYQRVENMALITGFVTLDDRDFRQPFVSEQKKKHFMRHKTADITLIKDNELFEAFLSAFYQLCEEEHIECLQFQAQIVDKDGKVGYHTLPLTLKKPKKEKVQAYGFSYQIRF